jgi:hypothetical protein
MEYISFWSMLLLLLLMMMIYWKKHKYHKYTDVVLEAK